MDTPFVVQKYTCYFCVLVPETSPPPPHPAPYMSGTFVLAPLLPAVKSCTSFEKVTKVGQQPDLKPHGVVPLYCQSY